MPNDVLNSFRTKYPQYANVDDVTLASGIVSKYPQYAEHLKDVLPQPMSAHEPQQPTLGQEMLAPIRDPQARYQSNIQDYRNAPDRGGKVAAMLGQLNAGAQQLYGYTGLPQAETLLRKIPSNPVLNPTGINGNTIADIIGAIPKGLGWTGSNAVGGAFELLPKNLGTSPESAQKIKAQAEELGGTAAQIFAPKLLGSILPKGEKPTFKPAFEIPKPDAKFVGALERTSTRGGIKAQVKDIELVRSDLSEAYKNGLNPDPKMLPSEKLSEPLTRAKADLYAQEEAAAARHPKSYVPINKLDAVKILGYGKEIGVGEKYANVQSAVDNGTLSLSQTQRLLADLNADVHSWYDSMVKEGEAPSPSVKAKLNEMKTVTDNVRRSYIQRMSDVGEGGVKEVRVRYGALDGLLRDIAANKNALDRLPESIFKFRPLAGTNIRGNIIYTIHNILGKSPKDYAFKAAKEWASMDLHPEGITYSKPNVAGLLEAKYPMGMGEPISAHRAPHAFITNPSNTPQLPPRNPFAMPEYMGEQWYSGVSPENRPSTGSFTNVNKGKFPVDEIALKNVVESQGGKFKGISDMGKSGKWVIFDEPIERSTVGVRLEEFSPSTVKRQIDIYAAKKKAVFETPFTKMANKLAQDKTLMNKMKKK